MDRPCFDVLWWTKETRPIRRVFYLFQIEEIEKWHLEIDIQGLKTKAVFADLRY